MRSYRQFCPLARALDRIGDRWTLLIVRELFSRDGRYADLRDALPGIATNLLAERLRQLQSDGIIASYEAPRPVNATVYTLTARGRALGPALQALVSWGAPLLAEGQGDDAFRTHWMALALPGFFDGAELADIAPLTVLVDTGDEPATLHITDAVAMTPGRDGDPDVTIGGTPDAVVAFFTGAGEAAAGAALTGPPDAVHRLRTLTSRCRLAGSRPTADGGGA